MVMSGLASMYAYSLDKSFRTAASSCAMLPRCHSRNPAVLVRSAVPRVRMPPLDLHRGMARYLECAKWGNKVIQPLSHR
jgi:hypothetical protein